MLCVGEKKKHLMKRVCGENQPKLLDQIKISLRTSTSRLGKVGHYNPKTEKSYTPWIKQFIIFNNKVHPNKFEPSNIRTVSKSPEQNPIKITMIYTHVLNQGSCL